MEHQDQPRRLAYAVWEKNAFRRPSKWGAPEVAEFLDLFVGVRPEEHPVDTHKKALPSWAPFVLTQPHHEELEEKYPSDLKGLQASCLVIDYDGGRAKGGLEPPLGKDDLDELGEPLLPPGAGIGPDTDELVDLWAGFVGVFHTTWGHEPEAPRTRAILPLSRDVTGPEYAVLHQWAELRSADTMHRADPAGRALGRRWVLPRAVRPGRSPRVVVITADDGAAVLDVDTVLVWARALQGNTYVAAGARKSKPMATDLCIESAKHADFPEKWLRELTPGDSVQVYCPLVDRSTLGAAWLRRYRSGLGLFCTSENHGHDVPLRLWLDATDQGVLGAAPEPTVLEKLRWNHTKDGERKWPPPTTLLNVEVVLNNDPRMAGRLWYDDFSGEIQVVTRTGTRPMSDKLSGEIALWLETHYGMVGVARAVEQGIPVAARRHSRDSLVEWLESHQKDAGAPTDLLEQWLVRGFGAEDTPLVREMGRMWLTQVAARGLNPGQKGDLALVLVGKQGKGKSEGLNILCGGSPKDQSPLFLSCELDGNAREIAMQIRKKLVCEIAELAGMRKRDQRQVKALLTTRVDEFRAPYERYVSATQRRCSFVATTNDAQFLSDPTGSRRYLAVSITGEIDWDWILRWRASLWAMARDAAKAGAVAHIPRDRAAEFAEHNAAYQEDDPWEKAIVTWIETGVTADPLTPFVPCPPVFSTEFVARAALGIQLKALNRGALGQIGRVVTDLGKHERRRLQIGGSRQWFYVDASLSAAAAQRYLSRHPWVASGPRGADAAMPNVPLDLEA